MIDKTTSTDNAATQETQDSVAAQRGQLDTCIRRRNRSEFIVGGAAIAFLIVVGTIGLVQSARLPDTVAALGTLLVAAGLGLTLWRLNRHIAAQRDGTPIANPKAALAWRLKRERDLLRSVGSWYIGPMLPGYAMIWGGLFAGGSIGTALVGTFITVAAIAWIAHANLQAAAAFDNQLRQIDPVGI